MTEKSLEKAIQEESERVKRAFPEAFNNVDDTRRKTKRRKPPATAEQAPNKGGKPSKKLDAESQKFYDALVKQGRKPAADEFKRSILES